MMPSPPTCRRSPVMFRSETSCLKFTYSRPASLRCPQTALPSSPCVTGPGPTTRKEKERGIRIPKSVRKDDDEMGKTRWKGQTSDFGCGVSEESEREEEERAGLWEIGELPNTAQSGMVTLQGRRVGGSSRLGLARAGWEMRLQQVLF